MRSGHLNTLGAIFGGDESVERPKPVDPDVEAARLRDACAVYHRVNAFAVGDLVRLKRGIMIASNENRHGSSTGIYVIMEVDPTAEIVRDPHHQGSYGVRFDVCVGYYDADGDFIFMWADARRFEPVPAADLAAPAG